MWIPLLVMAAAVADFRPVHTATSKIKKSSDPNAAAPVIELTRTDDVLAAAVRVEAIECAHALEAEVRELRLIAAHGVTIVVGVPQMFVAWSLLPDLAEAFAGTPDGRPTQRMPVVRVRTGERGSDAL